MAFGVVAGIEPNALCMLYTQSTTALQFQLQPILICLV